MKRNYWRHQFLHPYNYAVFAEGLMEAKILPKVQQWVPKSSGAWPANEKNGTTRVRKATFVKGKAQM